jgi:hypothetical protein
MPAILVTTLSYVDLYRGQTRHSCTRRCQTPCLGHVRTSREEDLNNPLRLSLGLEKHIRRSDQKTEANPLSTGVSLMANTVPKLFYIPPLFIPLSSLGYERIHPVRKTQIPRQETPSTSASPFISEESRQKPGERGVG